jgi:hypothetical protein
MINMKIEMESPSMEMPCGERLAIPLSMYAVLRGAGGQTLVVKQCPKCNGKHRLELNPLLDIVVDIKPDIATMNSPLLGNGRRN